MNPGLAAIVLTLGFSSAALAQDRFPEMKPDQMNTPQKAMYEAIMAGPRHSMAGPFNAWLPSPELGDRLQNVGEYLRFKTTVPHALNEFAILITAVEWSCVTSSRFDIYKLNVKSLAIALVV